MPNKPVTPKAGMVFVTRDKKTRTPSRRIVATVGDDKRPTRICYSIGTNKPRWCDLRAFRLWMRTYGAVQQQDAPAAIDGAAMNDNPDQRGTLTRKAGVLLALEAGWHIYWRGPGRLYELVDKHGNHIGAWQNALKAALKEWRRRQRSPVPR